MIRTVHGRLTAVVVALFALGMCLALVFASASSRSYAQEERQRLDASLASTLGALLESEGLFPPTPANRARGIAEMRRLMAINPSIDVYLLDHEGRVVSSTALEKTIGRMVGRQAVGAFLKSPRALPLRGTDPRGGEARVFSAATPSGFVYVVLGRGEATISDALAEGRALRSIAGLFAGTVAFATLAGAYVFWALTVRLRRLVSKVERRSSDMLGSEVLEVQGGDEIDGLDRAFDSVTRRVRSLLDELHGADVERRQLVQNVSHDLRTPVAGLRGYLETMLVRGESLGPEERRDHLETALRQVDRLGRLIEGLLELGRLESARLELVPEAFVAAELAQDVLQEFRLRAQAKGVELLLRTDDGETQMVADIGLVERALVNLLENALRHTPRGGWVELAATREPGFVRLSVGDSGVGISPDALDRIFERGVRIEDAKDGGAGLGLAIVQRIVALHGARVGVQSEVGAGSRFCMFFPAP